MDAISKELLQEREQLLTILRSLTDEELNAKDNEHLWTVGQVFWHLVLTEQSVTKVIKIGLSHSIEIDEKAIPMEIVVNRSVRVDAPDDLFPPAREYSIEELDGQLTASRDELLKLLTQIDDSQSIDHISPTFRHPFLGMLSIKQWIIFIGKHELRHAAQIHELLHSHH
ncbi:DinB family protein [Sulfoacidibacillus ferrooxidans]|uniref:DinB-like domain-containing protein n=1 Tax=Sulfoacidibacillus ferrooxidans TaxID=2005001 RepID=A0A9X2ACP7_9BACL|nr:DinB family protein [Sulfoacidibacillus ferrooxidans]MCI0183999.1 hypothetical protein [Sulfoacidibacillus ferrooxidans]